jgi:ABC-type bacteriocin/lantibiotic exporter with double-glycine peptidase domain
MGQAIESKLTGHPLKRFFRLLQIDRKAILYIYLYAIFNGLINLTLPLGIQAIIGLTLADELSTSWIILIFVVTTGTAIAGLMQIMQISITEMIQQKVFTRATFEFSYRLPRIRMEALHKYYAPELVNRFFDVMNVQKGLPKILIDLSTALLQIFFGLILLSFYNSAFVFFGLALLVILFLIFRFTGPTGLKTSLEESNYKYEVGYWLEEIGRTLATFKLAGKTNIALDKTNQLTKQYLKSRKAHFRVLLFQYGNIVAFKTIVTAGLLILGSFLLIERQINLGQFVASEIIILLIIASVEKIILNMETIYDVLTGLEKIGKVTDMPLEKPEGLDYETMRDLKKGMGVELRDVSFTFPGEELPVLHNINLDIKEKEKICIAGESGSGKTLLLSLISGIYERFHGALIYNELPFNNYDIVSLRSYIGDILSQKTLFRGTILENITMGRERVTLADVQWALDNVGLTDYINRMHEGLNTMLSPEGRQLPRSVVRRLIMAKAIVKRPHLVVMDDIAPTNRKDIREDIFQFLCMEECWTLVGATNDPAFASRCDRVLVMAQGTIIDQGDYPTMSKKYPNLFNVE